MIIDEKEDVVELDYEGMYKALSKEKRSYKEQLHAAILGCVGLEFSINDLINIQIKKTPLKVLEKISKNPRAPVSKKLKALKKAGLIDEELFSDMGILFRIRNKFGHEIPLPFNRFEKEFRLLKDIKLENDFVKNLSNDSVKFQLVVSHCFTKLLYISKKIDPNSVLELVSVGEIKPVE